MSLKVGIIGLPNAGKSTLFNALVKKNLALVADYPFTTIKPQEAVVEVPNMRLDRLATAVKPQKTTPATVTFVDIAGLVKGAHKGEGLGNEFLGHIRDVDALLVVVRDFDNANISHPMGSLDIRRDIEIINTELILKDLQTVEKAKENEKDKEKKEVLLKIKNHLNCGKLFQKIELSDKERMIAKELKLLTGRPILYLVNISEKDISKPKTKKLKQDGFIVVCAKLEAELSEFTTEEQEEYLESLGETKSGLEQVIKQAYKVLGLFSFFTIKGGREVKAWSLTDGSTAKQAAEKVHTDMAKGFIKAQVINVDKLVERGSWQEAEKQGKIRFEGKDYVVADGDVIEFRFKT